MMWIILALIVIVVVLITWSACKVAGDYDDLVDEQLEKIQQKEDN